MISLLQMREFFNGKRVAIIGSAPSCLDNRGDVIDGYDAVIRINNFKIAGFEKQVGERIDVHYSFYGNSIRTDFNDLKKRGLKLHMCKCPNSRPYVSQWHIENKGPKDDCAYNFRYIYNLRDNTWVAPVYIPSEEHYLTLWEFVNRASPTTGFACIWEIMQTDAAEVYITGFDFFTSRMHNVNEHWKKGRDDDPLRHRPDFELERVKQWAMLPHVRVDRKLKEMIDAT
jgi:hypothetical protein